MSEHGFTEQDFTVQDEGTLVILHPCNDAASEWIQDCLYDEAGNGPQWWGGGVVIEHRYIGAILQGIEEEGFAWA